MKELHFYRHEDLVIKKLSQDYGQEFLDYLDALYHENHENPVELPCKTIKTESSTELVTSSLKNMYMDFTYVLVDGSILHFEHYSTVLTDENLTNTALYAFEKHKETDEQIITIIVSTADPEKSLRELWLNPVTNFTPFRVIFLKEYDGNEKLKKIKKKINNNEKLTFNEANTMLNKGYSLKEVVEITQLNMNTIKQLKLGK